MAVIQTLGESNDQSKEEDMSTLSTIPTPVRTELAQRTNGGIDVTLFWERRDSIDNTFVQVRDRDTGASFEIAAEPELALEVYYHPFAYQSRLADEGAESQPPTRS